MRRSTQPRIAIGVYWLPVVLAMRLKRMFHTCRIVGRPCGQLHGLSSVAIWRKIAVSCSWLRAVPIITAERQARDANIDTTREGRHGTPGCSASSDIISNTSAQTHAQQHDGRVTNTIHTLTQLTACSIPLIPNCVDLLYGMAARHSRPC
jgi:hypothetical protein